MPKMQCTIKCLPILVVISCALFSARRAEAQGVPQQSVIYVDASSSNTANPSPSNPGDSWANAYTYLQNGLYRINQIQTPSESNIVEIRVRGATGDGMTYKPDLGFQLTPGNRAHHFVLVNYVRIVGSYIGGTGLDADTIDPAYISILSGDLANDDNFVLGTPHQLNNYGDNSYSVVFSQLVGEFPDPLMAHLENFVVRGAGGLGTQPGGIHIMGSDPHIRKCTIIQNRAGVRLNGGGPTLRDCTIAYNHDSSGGGVRADHADGSAIVNCVISNNTSSSGAGMSSSGTAPVLNIVATQFFSNVSSGSGGGLNIGSSTPASTNIEVTNCLFHNNVAGTRGGAVLAFSNARFHGCTFSANSASTGGGGIAIGGTSPLNPELTIRNCILWDNTSSTGNPEIFFIPGTTSTATVTYSDVEGELFTGTGNENYPPAFVNPAGPDAIPGTIDDDYRLQCISQAINDGDPNSGNSPSAGIPGIPEDTDDADADSEFGEKAPDRALGERLVGTVDMGAYERPGPDDDVVCLGDVQVNCVVDVDDLLLVINNWGTGGDPDADTAPVPCGNNVVDVDDLLVIINGWGPCPGCNDESGITLQDAEDCMDAASLSYEAFSPEWDDYVNKCVEGLRAAGLIP